MMRRQGATGDDWSDWDAHLPASPPGSTGLPEALSSLSLSRSLSKQTSDKFEVAEGALLCPYEVQDELLKSVVYDTPSHTSQIACSAISEDTLAQR